MDNPDPLLASKEAARYLNYSTRTLESWRQKGTGPVYIAGSARAIRYRKSALDRWLAERERRSTSDMGPQPNGGLK